MKTYLGLLLGMIFTAGVLHAVAPNAVVSPPSARIEAQHAADWVLVRLKPEVANEFVHLSGAEALEQLAQGLGLPPGARLREPAVNARLRGLKEGGKAAPADAASLWERFLYLDLPKGLGVVECLDRLRGHPWLEYAEADSVVIPLLVPCDDDFASQWWLAHGYGEYYNELPFEETQGWPSIRARDAWEITTGSPEVVVGIVDTGVDGRLLEFAGRLVPGWNVADDNEDTMDHHWHGTTVAYLLGGNANNPHPRFPEHRCLYGVGVDWQCKIMPVRTMDRDRNILLSYVSQGVDYAVAQGCRIVNLSWRVAWPSEQEVQTIIASVANAIANGVVVVCSTEGSGQPIQRYPAKFEPSIAVVGSQPPTTVGQHTPVEYSSYGPEVDLMAPGWFIWSIMPDEDHPELGQGSNTGGSSAAAALVSGVCSLLASVRPDLTHEQAKLLLCAGADDQGTPGYDIYTGWGQLNAYHSLLLATARIDHVRLLPVDRVEFSWRSPSNAVAKDLFRMQFTEDIEGTWTDLPAEGFRQEAERTYWTGPLPAGPTTIPYYFRLRVKLDGLENGSP